MNALSAFLLAIVAIGPGIMLIAYIAAAMTDHDA